MQVSRALMQEIDALLEDADERYELVQIALEQLFAEVTKAGGLCEDANGELLITKECMEALSELNIKRIELNIKNHETVNNPLQLSGEEIRDEIELSDLIEEEHDLQGRLRRSFRNRKRLLFELNNKLILKTDTKTRLRIISAIELYWDDEILEYLGINEGLSLSKWMSYLAIYPFRKVKKVFDEHSIKRKIQAYLFSKDALNEFAEIKNAIEEDKKLIFPVGKDLIRKLQKGDSRIKEIHKHILAYRNEVAKMLQTVFSINQKLRSNMNEYEINSFYQEEIVSEIHDLLLRKKNLSKEILDKENLRNRLEGVALDYVNGAITNSAEFFSQINKLLEKENSMEIIGENVLIDSIRKLDKEGTGKAVIKYYEGYIDDNYDEYYYRKGGDVSDSKPWEQLANELKKTLDLLLALIIQESFWYEKNGEWYYCKPGLDEGGGINSGYQTTYTVTQCKDQIRNDLGKDYPACWDIWIDCFISCISNGKYTKEVILKRKRETVYVIRRAVDKIKEECDIKVGILHPTLPDTLEVLDEEESSIKLESEPFDSLYDVDSNALIEESGKNGLDNWERSFQILGGLLLEQRYKFFKDVVLYPFDSYPIISVWYDTWQYATFSLGNNLAKSLFDSIFVALREKRQPYFKWAGKFMRRFGAFIFGTVLNINDPVDSFFNSLKSDDYKDYAEELTKLKGSLYDLVTKKTKTGKGKRLVILIDNLDRLQPVKAVELLEILKLFFDCPNCIFILAIDEEAVMQGVKEKYGKDLPDEKAKEFFGKIVQLPLRLPEANYDLEKFIDEKVENIFDSNINKNSEIYFYDHDKEEIIIKQEELKWFTDCIDAFHSKNPRKLIRFFNMYQFFLSLVTKETACSVFSIKFLQSLYLATAFKIYNPKIYEVLTKGIEQDKKDILKDVDSVEEMQGKGFLIDFLNSEKAHNVKNADYLAAAVEATQFNAHGLLQKYFFQAWKLNAVTAGKEYVVDKIGLDGNSACFKPFLKGKIKDSSLDGYWYSVDEYEDYPFYYDGMTIEEVTKWHGEWFNGFQYFESRYNVSEIEEAYWGVIFKFRGLKKNSYAMDIIVCHLHRESLGWGEGIIDNVLRELNRCFEFGKKDKIAIKKEEMDALFAKSPEFLQEEIEKINESFKRQRLNIKFTLDSERDMEEKDILNIPGRTPSPVIYELISGGDQKFMLTCYTFENVKSFNSQREGRDEVDKCISEAYAILKECLA